MESWVGIGEMLQALKLSCDSRSGWLPSRHSKGLKENSITGFARATGLMAVRIIDKHRIQQVTRKQQFVCKALREQLAYEVLDK